MKNNVTFLFIVLHYCIFSQGYLNLNTIDSTTQHICDDSIKLDAGISGKNYLWSTGDSSQTISITSSGFYFVHIYDTAFSFYDSVSVVFHQPPASHLKDTSLCGNILLIPDSAQLINHTSQFLWSTGDTLPFLNVHQTGTYWVKISNGYCTTFDTMNYINLTSDVILTTENIVCDGTYLLNAGEGVHYLWSTGETTEIITISNPGIYSVTVTNFYGCTKTASVTIYDILTAPDFINVPNTFTPNGDGINDFFYINVTNHFYSVFSLSIYDRWGKLMWEAEESIHKWDGQIKKKEKYETDNYVVDGVYYWVLKYKPNCRGGKINIKNGFVNVYR